MAATPKNIIDCITLLNCNKAYIGAPKLRGPWAMTHIFPYINPALLTSLAVIYRH